MLERGVAVEYVQAVSYAPGNKDVSLDLAEAEVKVPAAAVVRLITSAAKRHTWQYAHRG